MMNAIMIAIAITQKRFFFFFTTFANCYKVFTRIRLTLIGTERNFHRLLPPMILRLFSLLSVCKLEISEMASSISDYFIIRDHMVVNHTQGNKTKWIMIR